MTTATLFEQDLDQGAISDELLSLTLLLHLSYYYK